MDLKMDRYLIAVWKLFIAIKYQSDSYLKAIKY